MYVAAHLEWSCDFVIIYVLFYIQIIYLFEFYLWLGNSDTVTDLRIMLLIYFSMIIWRLTKMTKNGAYFIVKIYLLTRITLKIRHCWPYLLKQLYVIYFTSRNKINNHLASQLSSMDIKKQYIYNVGNPCQSVGQAYTCGGSNPSW